MCLCAETLDADSIVARIVEARASEAREAREATLGLMTRGPRGPPE